MTTTDSAFKNHWILTLTRIRGEASHINDNRTSFQAKKLQINALLPSSPDPRDQAAWMTTGSEACPGFLTATWQKLQSSKSAAQSTQLYVIELEGCTIHLRDSKPTKAMICFQVPSYAFDQRRCMRWKTSLHSPWPEVLAMILNFRRRW